MEVVLIIKGIWDRVFNDMLEYCAYLDCLFIAIFKRSLANT